MPSKYPFFRDEFESDGTSIVSSQVPHFIFADIPEIKEHVAVPDSNSNHSSIVSWEYHSDTIENECSIISDVMPSSTKRSSPRSISKKTRGSTGSKKKLKRTIDYDDSSYEDDCSSPPPTKKTPLLEEDTPELRELQKKLRDEFDRLNTESFTATGTELSKVMLERNQAERSFLMSLFILRPRSEKGPYKKATSKTWRFFNEIYPTSYCLELYS
jgi:hypothetical protein